MNEAAPDPSRHKAVLAAVLAVQRGFLSPDEAVRVLAELPPGESADSMQTLLSVAPTSAKAQIEAEVQALAERPDQLSATLAEIGVSPEEQSTLFSLSPDTASEAATKALSSLTERQQRVRDMTSRLPSASGTGRYQVKREFARGGMGLIWVAMDTAVGREVALKELLPSKPGSGTTPVSESPELIERFLREAKVTGQLEHPNIVPVYEIATRDDGSVFYTMKLVRGKTMAHRLLQIQNGNSTHQQKLGQRLKLLDAFLDVCNAVAYAHSRGELNRVDERADVYALGAILYEILSGSRDRQIDVTGVMEVSARAVDAA